MDLKNEILSEIRRLAAETEGTAPGQVLFERVTGIGQHKWRGVYWSKWGDALREAGFEANEWNSRFDSAVLLRRISEAVLETKALPTKAEMQLRRRADPTFPAYNVIANHFGGSVGLVRALQKLAQSEPTLSEVANYLPSVPEPKASASFHASTGWVYLLKSGPHYKVGRSDNLEKRIKQIAISLPEHVVLVHAIETDDPIGIEAYWHQRFADRRMNGEWFQLTPVDLAAFKKRKFQ